MPHCFHYLHMQAYILCLVELKVYCFTVGLPDLFPIAWTTSTEDPVTSLQMYKFPCIFHSEIVLSDDLLAISFLNYLLRLLAPSILHFLSLMVVVHVACSGAGFCRYCTLLYMADVSWPFMYYARSETFSPLILFSSLFVKRRSFGAVPCCVSVPVPSLLSWVRSTFCLSSFLAMHDVTAVPIVSFFRSWLVPISRCPSASSTIFATFSLVVFRGACLNDHIHSVSTCSMFVTFIISISLVHGTGVQVLGA